MHRTPTPTDDDLATQAVACEIKLLCLVGYNVRRIRTARGDRHCDLLLGLPTVESLNTARTNANRIEQAKLTMTSARISELAAALTVDVTELLRPPDKAQPDEIAYIRVMGEKRLAARGLPLDLLAW